MFVDKKIHHLYSRADPINVSELILIQHTSNCQKGLEIYVQNMYNKSIFLKLIFYKPPHIYINDAIIHNNLQSIKYYGILR